MKEFFKYIFRPRKIIIINHTYCIIRKIKKMNNCYITSYGYDDILLEKEGKLLGQFSYSRWKPISGWSEQELKELGVN